MNPTYLWAFLGLGIPIAIHLWSRKEGRTIKIGSIQLLRESDPKQSSSIRINEWWLLFLRLLLLSFLVLIMAGPQLRNTAQAIPLTYLVEPSLLKDERVKRILDTINGGAALRLLSAGFPEIEEAGISFSSDPIESSVSDPTGVPIPEPPNYWQLAVEMEELSTDSIVVFTKAFSSGLRGQRPVSRKGISWVILPDEENEKKYLEAVRKNDRIELISIVSDANSRRFEKEVIPMESNRFSFSAGGDSISLTNDSENLQLALRPVDSLSVSLFYSDSLAEEMKYIRASFGALSKYLNRSIEVAAVMEKDSLPAQENDVLVWLSGEPITKERNLVLQYKPDSLAPALITPGLSRNHFYLTGNLSFENVVEAHFAEQLYLFLNLHPNLEEKVRRYDRRTVARKELLPKQAALEFKKDSEERRDVSGWLWTLLLITLIAERILAHHRKQ